MKKLLKQGGRDKQKGVKLIAKENPKGITLIALVITIVVLLILAGITINLLFAEGGILKKADEANKAHKEAMNSDWEAINDITDKINGLVDGTGSTGSGEGGTGGSSGGSEGVDNEGGDTGGGDSEGGSSGVTPDESWKELTADERAKKLQEEKPVTYLFYDGDEKITLTDASGKQAEGYSSENHFNTIGDNKLLTTEAICRCGHAREIFEKAKEMELVTIYDQIENIEETTTDGHGHIGRTFLTIPITEPSMVYYNFECHSKDQKPGGTIPMPYSLNYEVSLDGGDTWLDAQGIVFSKESGNYDTALAWLGVDYVKLGYSMMRARAELYPSEPIIHLGQTLTMNIQVLTQTDFMKAAKELNLDLSSYNCIHPNK